MDKEITVSCPGACGELFQGFLGQSEYLVTLPIAIFNTISLKTSKYNDFPNCVKIKQAFDLTCDHFNLMLGERPAVKVMSQQRLPVSKGMSSSTADIVATIHGTARLLNRQIKEATVAKICCQIEKTDSLLFSTLTVMNSTTSEVIYRADWQPEMKVLVLEGAGSLDTDQFHLTRSQTKAAQQTESYQAVFELFQEAIAEKSVEKIGRVSTLSSHLNQQLLPKPHFQELLTFVERYQLLGIMVAHSGTVVGFLLEPNREFPQELFIDLSQKHIQLDYPNYYLTRTIFGGPRFL